MAGPKEWTEALIAARVKAGRGQGSGEDYSPWLYVQEFSSRGTQTRIPGVKLKRTIHTFSYIERAFFLVAEFLTNFGDWQEQRPMDRGVTLGAAAKLGIKHPVYPRTRVPVVMTLDAVHATTTKYGRQHLTALDFKPERRLRDERTRAKLSLHRAYCAHVNLDHALYTENSVSRAFVRNIDWVRMALPKEGELEVVPGLLTVHLPQFEQDMLDCRKRLSITQFCQEYDQAHHLELGTGLRLFKLLVWEHRVSVNMEAPRLELEPLPRRGVHRPLPMPKRVA